MSKKQNETSLSRRGFIEGVAKLPVTSTGVLYFSRVTKVSSVGAALFGSGALVSCSETEVSGAPDPYGDSKKNFSQGEASNDKGLRSQSGDDDEGASEGSQSKDRSLSKDTNGKEVYGDYNSDSDSDSEGSDQGDGTTSADGTSGALSSSRHGRNELQANLKGAEPVQGFFSRGAPRLTRDQIEAGVAIEGTCEGTNHKLKITSEQLKMLANGQEIQVKSETNSHAFNPTNHSHTVTYRPILG